MSESRACFLERLALEFFFAVSPQNGIIVALPQVVGDASALQVSSTVGQSGYK